MHGGNCCGINGTFTLSVIMHNLDIIKNKRLVAKHLLMNVTKMNAHSNLATFVGALIMVIH